MSNYFNLNTGEIILSMILGLLLFIASYGIPFLVYFLGDKKIKEKQESFYTIVMVALLLQLLGCILFFSFITILDLYGKFSTISDNNFSTSAMIFFAGDWGGINIGKIAESFKDSAKAPSTLGIMLMAKAIWIFLNIAYISIPLILIYKVASGIILKYKSDFSSGALNEVALEFSTTLFGAFFLFAIHTQIPVIFMDYYYTKNKSGIESKVGDGVRKYSYQGVTGDYIRNSIELMQKIGVEGND